jgi:hypothetical protein
MALDSGELRRAVSSPCGAFASSPQALPSGRGDSSVLPPFVTIAPARRLGRSRPCGSISLGFLPHSRCLWWRLHRLRRLDGVCNPGVFPRCGAVLGRLAMGSVLLRRRRSTPDGGVLMPQLWLRRRCRRHDLPLAPLRAPLWFSSYPSVSVFMSWWPGQWARHACLLLLCCARSCDVILESYTGLCRLLLIFSACFS